ncbi:MAG: hypothetical protein Q8N53_18770 [Longimicrobiales bacterium]|nr:hypothetical protein [Longimicrobiales bacterium]
MSAERRARAAPALGLTEEELEAMREEELEAMREDLAGLKKNVKLLLDVEYARRRETRLRGNLADDVAALQVQAGALAHGVADLGAVLAAVARGVFVPLDPADVGQAAAVAEGWTHVSPATGELVRAADVPGLDEAGEDEPDEDEARAVGGGSGR